jgi:hypothetical protein
MASTLTPNDGIVHEWITSMDEVISRNEILNGMISRLSVSSSRNWFNEL